MALEASPSPPERCTSDGLICGRNVLAENFIGGDPKVLESWSSSFHPPGDPKSENDNKDDTSRGRRIAVKLSDPNFSDRTDFEMMHLISEHPGTLVPKVYGCYQVSDVNDDNDDNDDNISYLVMTSEVVDGITLQDAWPKMDAKQKEDLKRDFQEQMKILRSVKQPYIGRIGNKATRNVFDLVGTTKMGPFKSEAAFNEWCLSRCSWPERVYFSRMMKKETETRKKSYVLSHLDLHPQNFLVNPITYKLNGIVDFENCGFFPAYMEYAVAMRQRDHEEWWLELLKTSLPKCEEWRELLVCSLFKP